jgi:hypothetical protein
VVHPIQLRQAALHSIVEEEEEKKNKQSVEKTSGIQKSKDIK